MVTNLRSEQIGVNKHECQKTLHLCVQENVQGEIWQQMAWMCGTGSNTRYVWSKNAQSRFPQQAPFRLFSGNYLKEKHVHMSSGEVRFETAGVSVVVPVYQSTNTLIELCSRIEVVLSQNKFEIILVDDGSKPETWNVIKFLSEDDSRIKGLRLSRNYGQHSAILAGIRAAKHDLIVTLDDDLQNPPEEIPRLIRELNAQQLDIVYGQPEEVQDRAFRKVGGRLIRLLMRLMLGVAQAQSTSSFRVFHTRLRNAFWEDLGPSISIDALLSWASLNSGSVVVQHKRRESGQSNYSLRKLLRFTSDTITGYGIVPLQLATAIGFISILFGFCLLVFLVLQRLIADTATPGFTLLASLVTIFAGIQLMILGLIGEYLGRMHYRVMRKPSYVVRESIGQDSNG